MGPDLTSLTTTKTTVTDTGKIEEMVSKRHEGRSSMSLKKLISLAVAAFALLAIANPVSASADVHECPGNPQGTGYAPRNDRGVPNYVSSVRNMTCNRAGWAAVEHGFLTRSGNLRTAGWHCYVLKRYRSFGTLLGAKVRCVQRGKAFRWNWAT
jgi:hypothetical protein